MKQAFRICRNVESAFSTLQSAMARAALTPVFLDPGKFFVALPYTFLSAALMVFVLDAGLFSADGHISKQVRTAR